jgi:hypothetical protein
MSNELWENGGSAFTAAAVETWGRQSGSGALAEAAANLTGDAKNADGKEDVDTGRIAALNKALHEAVSAAVTAALSGHLDAHGLAIAPRQG